MADNLRPNAESDALAEALDDLVMSKGITLDDDRLDWLTGWVSERMAQAAEEALERVQAVLDDYPHYTNWAYISSFVGAIRRALDTTVTPPDRGQPR